MTHHSTSPTRATGAGAGGRQHHRQREESREIDQIETLYDDLSTLISSLSYFDENLKLKLHLNLELN